MPDGPLIVQSDKTLLLEVDHALAADCRRAIAPFAELERAPEHIHTYRLTPLGLWNARAAGHDAEQVIDTLIRYSRYAVPHAMLIDVAETMSRYGRLQVNNHPVHGLVLQALDEPVLEEVLRSKKVAPLLGARVDGTTVIVHPSERGHLKQALVKLGWPAEDVAGYVDGERHAIGLAAELWQPRPYQTEAAEGFWHGGSGVVVLPCGAGKTIACEPRGSVLKVCAVSYLRQRSAKAGPTHSLVCGSRTAQVRTGARKARCVAALEASQMAGFNRRGLKVSVLCLPHALWY